MALFAYASEEPGDLQFEAGEQIEVIKKESEWWTGKIGDRTGVFPYNYVEAAAAPAEEKTVIPEVSSANWKKFREIDLLFLYYFTNIS